MARGWESKSVEAQIESSNPANNPPNYSPRSAEENEKLREKSILLLSRKRVLQEMQASSNPRFREMLGVALADLEKKLAQFE